MSSSALIKAVAVTAELCGRTFSPEAAAVFVDDLSIYPPHQVIAALTRCRKEVRGVLTLQDVISRIDDGRPGPEEAWALLPMGESDTVVWTEEMVDAWAIARPLLNAGEIVPARMAFKETYVRNVNTARDAGTPVQWSASMGHDQRSREAALMVAVERGRLTVDEARELCPALPAAKLVMKALTGAVKQIPMEATDEHH